MNNIITISEIANNFMNLSTRGMSRKFNENNIEGIEINSKDWEFTKKFDNRKFIKMSYWNDKFVVAPCLEYTMVNKELGLVINFETSKVFDTTFLIKISVKTNIKGSRKKYLTDMCWMSGNMNTLERAKKLFDFLDGKTSTYNIDSLGMLD
jgi:hypothetical protein